MDNIVAILSILCYTMYARFTICFGMLIGMDIINKGDFTVSNHQGKTVFSFRMPSEGVMDFVTGIKISNIIKTNSTHNNKFKPKRKK